MSDFAGLRSLESGTKLVNSLVEYREGKVAPDHRVKGVWMKQEVWD